jgi:GDPmannose 4,6-dehydratase
VTGFGVMNLLEAIRISKAKVRLFQASSSEMFGSAEASPQNESTPFNPRNLYGVSKLFAHWTVINYQKQFNIFASNGILYNHESPLRGSSFVTKKITESVARISTGQNERISLGNLDSRRDWGHAKEYVDGMWRILNSDSPETFVLATGRLTSVRDFVKYAFDAVNIRIEFSGSGLNEIGVCSKTNRVLVDVDPKYYRPSEEKSLVGNSKKSEEKLGWRSIVSIPELAREMVLFDLRLLQLC